MGLTIQHVPTRSRAMSSPEIAELPSRVSLVRRETTDTPCLLEGVLEYPYADRQGVQGASCVLQMAFAE